MITGIEIYLSIVLALLLILTLKKMFGRKARMRAMSEYAGPMGTPDVRGHIDIEEVENGYIVHASKVTDDGNLEHKTLIFTELQSVSIFVSEFWSK